MIRKSETKNITEFEKSEIEYVIGNNGTIYEEKEDLNGRE